MRKARAKPVDGRASRIESRTPIAGGASVMMTLLQRTTMFATRWSLMTLMIALPSGSLNGRLRPSASDPAQRLRNDRRCPAAYAITMSDHELLGVPIKYCLTRRARCIA